MREFELGQEVYVRNYSGSPRWLKGVVEKRVGISRYLVKWNGRLLTRHINGRLLTRHINQRLLTRHINQMQKSGVEDEKSNKAANEKSNEEHDGIVIPPPHAWAEIIGVSGPEDLTIHQSSQGDASDIRNKRPRQSSSASPPQQHKRVALSDGQ